MNLKPQTPTELLRRSAALAAAALASAGFVFAGPPADPAKLAPRAQNAAVAPPDFAAAPRGYTAVVFLNRSALLVQPIVTFRYPSSAPVTWRHAVAPGCWESLVAECGVTEIEFVGVVPIDLETSIAGRQVDFDGAALQAGDDFACGSLLVVEIADAGSSVNLSLRVSPSLSGSDPAPDTSPVSPGSGTSLLLLMPGSTVDASVQARISWELPNGLVYVTRWDLNAASPRIGSLAECPVARIGWGDVTDSTAAGATLGSTPIAAPAPLASSAGLCERTIRFGVAGDADQPSSVRLSAVSDRSGSTPRAGEIDLFANLRALLNAEGFAGKLSGSIAFENPFPRGE